MQLNAYQRGLVFEELSMDCGPSHNIGGIITFHTAVDLPRLQEVLQTILKRQPILQSVISLGDEPELVLLERGFYTLPISHFESDGDFRKYVQSVFGSKVSLHTGPLSYFEACIIPDSVKLLVRLNHIIADGYSMAVLVREIQRCFAGSDADVAAPNSPLPIVSFSEEDRLFHLKNQKAFASAHPRGVDRRGAREAQRSSRILPLSLIHNMKEYAKKERESIFCLFLTAFSLALLRFEGEDILQIGVPVSVVRNGRDRPLGMYVNIVPYMADCRDFSSGASSEVVRKKWFSVLRHYRYPYARLSEIMGDDFAPYEYTINMIDHIFPDTLCSTPVSFENIHPGSQLYRLQCLIEKKGDTYTLSLDWITSAYTQYFAEYFLDYLVALCERLCEGKSLCMDDDVALPIDHLIRERCERESVQIDLPINPFRYFYTAAAKYPNSIAIRDSLGLGHALTYADVRRRTGQIVNALRQRGMQKGECAIVCLDHNINEIPVLLALMYLGCAFVPVNQEEWDENRISAVIKQTDSMLWIGTPSPLYGGPVVDVDEVAVYPTADALNECCSDETTAYILYTSGTTGTPKGVAVSNRALSSYITWAGEAYSLRPGDCMPVFSSLTFDFTLTSVFVPLCFGASVKMFATGQGKHPLFYALEDTDTTVVKVTPSHMRMISLTGEMFAAPIRLVIAGGENLTRQTLRDFFQCLTSRAICCNEYGPTETTIGCIAHFVQGMENDGNVPIGKPTANAAIRIVDEQMNPVVCFVKGEILITGTCLSQGYWREPNLTANVFCWIDGRKWYKTGDVGWYHSLGYIEYGGRRDEQAKYHGYRIELNEITQIVTSLADISEAVTVLAGQGEDAQIVLFYVPKNNCTGLYGVIKDAIAKTLPSYFVVNVHEISAMPLNSHGKIDTVKLQGWANSTFTGKNDGKAEQIVGEGGHSNLRLLLQTVKQVLRLQEHELDSRRSFIALGGDSIKAYSCIHLLRSKGFQLEYRHFRTPLSLAELSKKIVPVSAVSTFSEWNIPFEPTALILRFLRCCNNIGAVMQAICLDFTKPIEKELVLHLVQWMYQQHLSFYLNLDSDRKSLFYNSAIVPPEVVTVTDDELLSMCQFDVFREGLLKIVRLQGGNRLVLCVHHLAIDFVSWNVLLEEVDRFLSGSLYQGEEDTSFLEYCKVHAKDDVFDIKTEMKKHKTTVSIEDVDLTGRLTLCVQQLLIRPVDLIKQCFARVYCRYYDKADIVIELENPGRDKGEHGVGWYTAVSYNLFNTVEGDVPVEFCTLQYQDDVLRYNYIPLDWNDGFSSVRVVNDHSHFVWLCNVDYAAELDVLLSGPRLTFFITTREEGFLKYLSDALPREIENTLAAVHPVEDVIEIDSSVDLEDIKSLLEIP